MQGVAALTGGISAVLVVVLFLWVTGIELSSLGFTCLAGVAGLLGFLTIAIAIGGGQR